MSEIRERDKHVLNLPRRRSRKLRAHSRRFAVRRWLRGRWRWLQSDFKPGDPMTIVTVVLTGLGVVVAFNQFNDEVSREALAAKETAAQDKQAMQQSENNAPLLIPATPPAERGEVKTVALNTGQVKKRADRLYVAPRHPKEHLKARR